MFSRCVDLKGWFEFEGHICLVFDKYGLSLYDFLKGNEYRGFPLLMCRQFAFQLVSSVACLSFKLFSQKKKNLMVTFQPKKSHAQVQSDPH